MRVNRPDSFGDGITTKRRQRRANPEGQELALRKVYEVQTCSAPNEDPGNKLAYVREAF